MRVDGKYLVGWKAIADYFGVSSVSTVIRWATDDGMPVIRRKRGASVRAEPEKLAAWMEAR